MLSILKMFPRETKEKKMVKKPEMSFTDVDKYLKNLELKSYSLIEIVDLIRNIPTLKKEGLFRDVIFDNYYNDNELIFHPTTGKKISLRDVKVDLTYQRVLKLKVLIQHLRAKDKDNNPMNYDKMCAGSIDIAIRPEGDIYVWDGFRRSLIALLKGVQYPLFSIYVHSKSRNISECRAVEAFAFKKRNGDNEAMARDELYKSGLAFNDPKDLKTQQVLSDSRLDVLKTVPDVEDTLSGFAEFEDSLIKDKISDEYLIMASRIVRQSWVKDSTYSSYVICGVAVYIQLIESGAVDWSYNITGHDGSCEFLPHFKRYAKTNNQSKLTKNRLSNMGIATIAYRVGANVVNGLDAVQKNILAQKLGFDDDGIAQIVVDENLNNKETIIIKEHQDDLTKSVPELFAVK